MGNFSNSWGTKDIDACEYISRIRTIPVPDRREVLQIANAVCDSKQQYRREILKWHPVLTRCLRMLQAFQNREIRPDFCFELSLRNSIRIAQLRTEVEPVMEQLQTLISRTPRTMRYSDSKKMESLISEIEGLNIRLERLRSWFRVGNCVSKGAEESYGKFVVAKQRLASTGLRLVAKIAYSYGKNRSLMDMIQDGNAGLLVAAEKFDPEMGCAFTTYASHWIHERISKGIHRRATIRVPFEKLLVISKANRELAKRAEDSSAFDIEDSRQREPETGMWDLMQRTAINKALQKLDVRQKEIVVLRFGFDGSPPRSRQFIGERIGLSGERVRQIEKETLRILKAELVAFQD